MKKQEITCTQCEAEFYVEHEEDDVNFCPFCGEEFAEIEHEEFDLGDLFGDDI